jgi:hypothetical protein
MTNGTLEKLLGNTRRRRIALDSLRAEFAQERPELVTSGMFRQHLRHRLDELVSAGLILYPAPDGESWDTVGTPELPKWVQRCEREQGPRIDPDTVAWLPTMAFAHKLRRASDIAAAIAVNTFLIHRRHELSPVPLKERSLEIFGDEKALDRLCRGGALFGGQLKLETIGAFDPPPPLPFQSSGVPGLPLLLLENHHTYWSFSSWNLEARRYSAVVYGAGWVISRCGAALAMVLQQTAGAGIEYFGDVDPTGIRIALKLADQMAAAHVSPFQPAVELYTWVFEHGVRAPLARAPTQTQYDEATTWLPPSLHEGLRQLYAAGARLPQESLGLGTLKTWQNQEPMIARKFAGNHATEI